MAYLSVHLKELTTVPHDLYYRMSQYMKESKTEKYEECMNEIYALYRREGFVIIKIQCNNEFHEAIDKFPAEQTPPIKINYVAAQEHVPRAEINNRTIQKQARVNYYQLTYIHLTQIMVNCMVSEATRKLNYLPAKHRVSKYYSHRMIMHTENTNFEHHCQGVEHVFSSHTKFEQLINICNGYSCVNEVFRDI